MVLQLRELVTGEPQPEGRGWLQAKLGIPNPASQPRQAESNPMWGELAWSEFARLEKGRVQLEVQLEQSRRDNATLQRERDSLSQA